MVNPRPVVQGDDGKGSISQTAGFASSLKIGDHLGAAFREGHMPQLVGGTARLAEESFDHKDGTPASRLHAYTPGERRGRALVLRLVRATRALPL